MRTALIFVGPALAIALTTIAESDNDFEAAGVIVAHVLRAS